MANKVASVNAKAAFMPWRYGLFVLLCASAVVFGFLLPWYQAIMAGFDVAAFGYAATLRPLFRLDAAGMRKQAVQEDADRILLLALTAVIMITILTAVAFELTQVKAPDRLAVAFVIVTLAAAWCFSNMIYAIHYAHLYYDDSRGNGDRGGVEFPKTQSPDYWDFVYFAYTLGMTFQTSDVDITTRHIRRVVLFHSLAAFIFNLGILGFTINVLGSLGTALLGA